MSISGPVKNIPGRTSSAQYELLFQASIPALGFNTYYFEGKSKEYLFIYLFILSELYFL